MLMGLGNQDTLAAVAMSVEALVFIVIGRSCSEGCGFDFHCRTGRFHSRPIMYNAVCSFASSGVLHPSISDQFPLVPLDSIV